MRLSSSLNVRPLKGDVAALPLEFFFWNLLGGVFTCLDLGAMEDLVDLGVGVSILSKPRPPSCPRLLDWGTGLALKSIGDLEGVARKFFIAGLREGFVGVNGGTWRFSNQFHQ